MGVVRNPLFLFGRLAGFTCFFFVLAYPSPGLAERLTIFAAASLKNAMDAIEREFETESGVRLDIAYAGTAALARQIERGAPADVFVAASADWMAYLAQREKIVEGSSEVVARNRLVLVAAQGPDKPRNLTTRRDFGDVWPEGRIAMAFVDAVPAGQYGRTALEALSVWEEVVPFVVQTDNVRSALSLVLRREVNSGIVYRSDAAVSEAMVLGVFDSGLHPEIVYPAALIAGRESPEARAFLEFLVSGEAAAVFQEFGFGADD